MTDLAGGTYDLWARWESNHIEIGLGQVELIGCNEVELYAFLEGPLRADSMGTFLTAQIGTKDPYLGEDSVAFIPQNVVDWVLVQIRDQNDNTLILSQRAAFLTSQGKIISAKGNQKVQFKDNVPAQGYIALLHRNHLGIMTAAPVDLTQAPDFSDPNTPVFGFNPRKIVDGRALLFAGDANADGSINAVDKNAIWRIQNGQPFIYYDAGGDMNLDASVNVVDANGYWRVNNGKISQIPN